MLLKCIAISVVKKLGNIVGFGVGGDILVDTWEYWEKETKEEQRKLEVQALAQAAAHEVRSEVLRIIQQEAGSFPEAEQQQVAAYLNQVPAMIRRGLRRPTDPTGTTLPPRFMMRKIEDLARFLPPRFPRFKTGDRPLPGVDWELVELLGVGGFGEVWKARNPHFDGVPPVALKFCLDATAKDRLLKHEATVLNQVMRQGKHEGIVQLQQSYLSADPPCLAYELIIGSDLAGLMQEWHQEKSGFSPQHAAKVIHRLAEIMGFAHHLNPPIVHRDLKPANILVQLLPTGKFAFKIADFGIGGLAVNEAIDHPRRQTKREELLLATMRGTYTPLYASPQQMRGEPAALTDDVYSLGVIWYQLITGDLTRGRPGGSRWRRILTEQGMPADMLELLESCFEDRAADRPVDAAALADDLARLLAVKGQPALASPEQEQIKADASACACLIAAGKNSNGYLKAIYRQRLDIWRQYAEQGMPEAQWLYGDCLLEGMGVTKDQVMAARWFHKAAEQGFALAQMSLGNRYYRGEGVAKDIIQAILWYSRAAAQGQESAKAVLERIRKYNE